jgi:hypothetical protein
VEITEIKELISLSSIYYVTINHHSNQSLLRFSGEQFLTTIKFLITFNYLRLCLGSRLPDISLSCSLGYSNWSPILISHFCKYRALDYKFVILLSKIFPSCLALCTIIQNFTVYLRVQRLSRHSKFDIFCTAVKLTISLFRSVEQPLHLPLS